jgi:hypothetical protein
MHSSDPVRSLRTTTDATRPSATYALAFKKRKLITKLKRKRKKEYRETGERGCSVRLQEIPADFEGSATAYELFTKGELAFAPKRRFKPALPDSQSPLRVSHTLYEGNTLYEAPVASFPEEDPMVRRDSFTSSRLSSFCVRFCDHLMP